jgi:protein involved in polysaccharide export with SLBB domain
MIDKVEPMIKEGRHAEAKPLLKEFIEKHPKHPMFENVLTFAGHFALRDGYAEDAKDYFAQAIRLFPDGDLNNKNLRGLAESVQLETAQKQGLAPTPPTPANREVTRSTATLPALENIDDKTRAERIKSIEITYAEKAVQVAKVELEMMREANQKAPHTFPKLDIEKAELALVQAETNLELQKLIPRPVNLTTGMKPWASYIIEQPDILNVEVTRMVPKHPYKLQVFDVVIIDVTQPPLGDPISGAFAIEPGGVIQLGSGYGSVKIEGLSVEEAQEVITKHLESLTMPNPVVSVKLARMGDMQQIAGNHTVGPDGYITLGSYGRVSVSGLSVPDCQKAIVTHLSQFLEKPNVVVEMVEMPSKKYYFIVRTMGQNNRVTNETVREFPCAGNDTVLRAIAIGMGIDMQPYVGNVPTQSTHYLGDASIKHIRPGEEDKPPVVKTLEWEKILFSKSGFGDNLQLLPGDRIVLEMKQ